ncbi:hypothetical protein [uncultured Polaribacter sp.]|uniref:hypothetical protein n=1 Tax=uncultured Polaribacter sp. TaxID=174711 RepID=UPI0026359D92|nr:hypothetical protein [uncultured Polaribacter sp.]
MKKILSTIALALICFISQGQTQTQNLNMGLYQLQFPSASGGSNRIQSYAGTAPGKWIFKSRFDDIILDAGENSNNKYQILFKTGNIERVRINSDGKVGIGTSSPNSPLTIGYNNSSNQLAFKRLDGVESFSMNINSSNQIIFKNYSGGGDFDFQSNIGGQGLRSVLFFKGGNGNVGIGSINPDEKLTVKGKIHAEEVRVDLNVPADYVFQKYYTGFSNLKKEYKMPTLKEVEVFTKKHHHLPAIPSAKEIQKEGLHLKEMTNLLLQKIEELTLYTIAQEKRINALEGKLVEKKK